MKPNLIVVFQILKLELTDTFLSLTAETDNHGGDKMIFISGGLITKRFEYLETKQFA